MLSTGRIPVSLLEIDIPQKLQTPVNAELDVYAVKSQNETQFPERGALIYRKVALGAGPWVQIIRKTRMICSPARMNHPTLSKSLLADTRLPPAGEAGSVLAPLLMLLRVPATRPLLLLDLL